MRPVKPPNDADLARDIKGLEKDLSFYADERDWCESFESYMRRLGLNSTRQQETDWSGTALVTIDLSAYDSEIVRAIVGQPSRYGYSPPGEVEGTVKIRQGVSGQIASGRDQCVCDLVKETHLPDLLPLWARDATKIELEEVNCDNDDYPDDDG